MITWIRPSGTEITTNNSKASVEIAKANGWKEKGAKEEKKETPKKQAKKH